MNKLCNAMGINTKTVLLALTMTLSLTKIVDPVQPDQAYAIPYKSDFLSPEGKSRLLQEKSKYRYVGMERCASKCHNNEEMGFQYDIVKSSPHAQAFKILASERAIRFAKKARMKENPQESSVCLKCHVTGGGLDSSFFAATYKKEDGVTCEACHKGEYISKSFLPKETDCLKCHSGFVHKVHKFDFIEGCTKIAHPRPKAKP